MSTPIEQNTEMLRNLLNIANSLPDAGTSGGGGLPDGITAMKCGTFTPSADINSAHTVTHGLGQKPSFIIVVATGDVVLANFATYIYSQTVIGQDYIYGTNSLQRYGDFVTRYGTTSASLTDSASAISDTNENTMLGVDTFNIVCTTGRRLKAGVTYQWVCGTVEGII